MLLITSNWGGSAYVRIRDFDGDGKHYILATSEKIFLSILRMRSNSALVPGSLIMIGLE